ncbi:hypothetical protein AHAS_Ahas10G0001800 [Arachis hypogaea]
MGEQFLAVVTNTPFYDDDGSLVGIIYVSSDLQLFVETRVLCLAANNAESDHREDANCSRASIHRDDVMQFPFGIFSHGEKRSQGKSLKKSVDNSKGKSIHKIIMSRVKAWIQKKTMAWPWKANDQKGSEAKDVCVAVPFLSNDHKKNQSVNQKQEHQGGERNHLSNNEASGS